MNRLNDDDQPQVARASLEPTQAKHPFILRLKAKKSTQLQVWSKSFWGITIHFNVVANRSMPHYDDNKKCPGCSEGWPAKKKFYLFGWCEQRKQELWVEFTEAKALAIQRQLPSGCSLRGLLMYVTRTNSDNGRLNYVISKDRMSEELLGRDRDPMEALTALWHMKNGHPFTGKEFPTGHVLANGFLDPE